MESDAWASVASMSAGAIADLWKSERGLLALTLIIAATVLAALGHTNWDAWKEFSLYVFGIYTTAKTLTGAAQIIKSPTRPKVETTP